MTIYSLGFRPSQEFLKLPETPSLNSCKKLLQLQPPPGLLLGDLSTGRSFGAGVWIFGLLHCSSLVSALFHVTTLK